MGIVAVIISETIIFCVPLLLVALGGMCSERSGVINLALEGIMIVGALAACIFLRGVNDAQWAVNSPQLAVLIAILIAGVVGGLYSLFLAFAAIKLKADQTISGTALNIFAPAMAIIITWAVQGQGNTTIYLPTWLNIRPESLGLTASADPGFFEVIIFRCLYLTTPLAILILVGISIMLYKTKFGLRLRSCGEHPQAADSVGISVNKTRYVGVVISGVLAGIGGLAFTMAVGSGFQSTVAGYGFLALAVMIFGNWKPLPILGASALFALCKTVASMHSSIPFLPSFSNIKDGASIYLMLPYIVTMIVLAFTSKKSRAPKAEGIPYDKGKR